MYRYDGFRFDLYQARSNIDLYKHSSLNHNLERTRLSILHCEQKIYFLFKVCQLVVHTYVECSLRQFTQTEAFEQRTSHECSLLIKGYIFGDYLNFTVAMVTKMADKNRLKAEKMPFWTKFKDFGNQSF